uniref:Uncharacterized protein n=1 Tax=Physcomitrium patens TaxID=3218 RepID=A9TMN9_PHYPA|nr:hypothetical protein PHYPA_005592 [Physcomitrium patens]
MDSFISRHTPSAFSGRWSWRESGRQRRRPVVLLDSHNFPFSQVDLYLQPRLLPLPLPFSGTEMEIEGCTMLARRSRPALTVHAVMLSSTRGVHACRCSSSDGAYLLSRSGKPTSKYGSPDSSCDVDTVLDVAE